MSVRTPDPNPGWLSDQELEEIRRRLPLLYVEAVPVRVDGLGQVTEGGGLLRRSRGGRAAAGGAERVDDRHHRVGPSHVRRDPPRRSLPAPRERPRADGVSAAA